VDLGRARSGAGPQGSGQRASARNRDAASRRGSWAEEEEGSGQWGQEVSGMRRACGLRRAEGSAARGEGGTGPGESELGGRPDWAARGGRGSGPSGVRLVGPSAEELGCGMGRCGAWAQAGSGLG
jgi:hypothetical protein